MKRLLLWGSILAGLFLLVVLLAQTGSTNQTNGNTTLDTPVVEGEHIKGNPNARITLVEYSDFECPACAVTYPVLDQLIQKRGEDVRLIYRHFPLNQIHNNAQLAAQASEAAALQGKFWDMHDVLFNTQPEWSKSNTAEQFFIDLADSIDLNVDQFTKDLKSAEVKKAVNEDLTSGNKINIPGTPSIFLNGSLIQNPRSYAEYETLIDTALQNS